MSRYRKLWLSTIGGAAVVLAAQTHFADPEVLNRMWRMLAAPANAQDATASEGEGHYGLGREALPEEITAWDIDVRPDGQGLPVGSGDVMTGEELYIDYCATCHGDFGEAIGRWPVLAGGEDTLASDNPVKTTGSYWPYLSTIYDYVHRAMPFGSAQSLTDDEVYALTAYILYLNFLVEDDFVLSNENFAEVALPNEGGFFMDDRAEVELPRFSEEPCMSDCKESVEITMRARILDVTPDSVDGAIDMEGAVSDASEQSSNMAEGAADVGTPGDGAELDDATGEGAGEQMAASTDVAVAGPDPEAVAAGEKVFAKCKACHQVGEGAANASGPHLNGVVGRQIAAVEGFRYSSTLAEAGEAGDAWTEAHLVEFLADPRSAMKGTKMAFAGLRSDEDIAAVIAYLRSFE
jgi:cytochrome c2